MSVHVTSWVLKNSPAKLGDRLVLLVLADYAGEDGAAAFPSVPTIAREARLSERQVQRCLQRLVVDGAIEQRGETGRGVKVWRVLMGTGDEMSPPGVTSTADEVSQMSPDPPVEPPVPTLAAAPARPRDEIWDSLEEHFGAVAPKTNAHAKRNKAVADLRRAGATPETITAALRSWPRTFSVTATDVALATHYPQLVHRRQAAAPAPVAEVVDLPELSDDELAANRERLAALTAGIGRDAA